MPNKKKDTPFMDLYFTWMKDGKLPDAGLCNSVPASCKESVLLFEPSDEIKDELERNDLAFGFWGYEGHVGDVEKRLSFGDFRQTIVLFCAAINSEL